MFTTTACLGLARSVVNLDLCFCMRFAITLLKCYSNVLHELLINLWYCIGEVRKRAAYESSVRYASVFIKAQSINFCKLIHKLVGPNRRIVHSSWRDALSVSVLLRGQV